MGQTTSQSTVENITKQITDISTNISQSCVVNSSQQQNVDLSNSGFVWGGTATVKQQTEISNTCFTDLNKQAQLQTQIANAIKNATTTTGVAVLPLLGNNTAVSASRIENLIKTNVTMSVIQSNYNSLKQSQVIDAQNRGVVLGRNFEFTQGAQVFAAATLKAIENTGLITEIATKVDQSATSTTKGPLDFLADIFSGLAGSAQTFLIFFMFIVFILVGFGVYMFFQ